jgi:hypothetical protein
MRASRYYAWAVLDVENWSGRSAVSAANIQSALKRIEAQALARAGIDAVHVGRQPRGDGAILALPGDVAKELITDQFVEALREAVLEHDADCAPEESVRIRLSLHAGDAIDGDGEWAGQPVIVASRLVDSALIKRVLAAATGSPLALIVSGDWYNAVIKEGHASGDGYQKVWVEEKTFADVAWVKVPGRTRPPGLRPKDAPPLHRDGARPPPRPRPGGTEGHVDNSVTHGNRVQDSTIKGDVVFGDKYVGTDHRFRRGER